MKMRTLGRHHKLLQLLSDGEPKRRVEIKDGLGCMDAHSLQDLLMRGLADRMPRDTKQTPAWYIITSAGKKSYEALEAVDPYPEEMPDDHISRKIPWKEAHADMIRREGEEEVYKWVVPDEYGMTKLYYSGIDCRIAWRLYHWVEVDCPMSPYWIKHFENKIW